MVSEWITIGRRENCPDCGLEVPESLSIILKVRKKHNYFPLSEVTFPITPKG